MAVLLYCVTIELVIVNGQSTTDDDINVNEIVEFTARVAKLEGHLAAAIAKIAKLEKALKATHNSKFNYCRQSAVCVCVSFFVVFSKRRYASAVFSVIVCRRVSVRPSVRSRSSSTKTAKPRITQMTSYDSSGTLIF